MHIDEYEYGRIVIDGREERRDVIITPKGVHPNWWRKDGHALTIDDLDVVMRERPARLVVGTGSSGNMKPAPGVLDELAKAGIETEVMDSHAAVKRFNELVGLGEVDAAAAFHLTC